MKKKIVEEIMIPEGIEAKVDEIGNITIKGPKGEAIKKLISKVVKIKKEDKKIILECEKGSRNEKSIINVFRTHIKNVKTEGDKITIENFLGENIPRKARINKDVTIKITGDKIILESTNKESAGETATNIERATRIVNRDKRIFQDGIYITRKGDKLIEI